MITDLAWLTANGGAEEPRLIAELLGTVELERALLALGAPADRAAEAVDELLIGARAVVLEGGTVLAEPTTEGRLAAGLARHGEGVAGRYLEVPVALEEVARRAAIAGVSLSRPAVGPFGREVLVLGGPTGGPHVILVEADGTIASMTERQPTTLRRAEARDVERIATLFTDEGYPSGPSDIVERLGRYASAESQVIVADHGGEVLGFIALHAVPRFEHSDRILRVMALVVDAGVRERGIGRLLMEEAERVGRELGAAWSEVTAGHHRPDARRLYEELGYDGSVAAYLRKRL